ncbi:hypothetical protein [Peribacillus sp. NPDC096540]|uniref:hypothetical protein n=1 Tax=Peribacillus sp. NPDC096540 TaxID=3390612 RepID=UPI003CFDBA42
MENIELNQKETDIFQDLEENPGVRFTSNQNEMDLSQMPPSDQEEGSDEDRKWGKAGP